MADEQTGKDEHPQTDASHAPDEAAATPTTTNPDGSTSHVNADGQTVNAAPGSVAHDWHGTAEADMPKMVEEYVPPTPAYAPKPPVLEEAADAREFLTEFAPTTSKKPKPVVETKPKYKRDK